MPSKITLRIALLCLLILVGVRAGADQSDTSSQLSVGRSLQQCSGSGVARDQASGPETIHHCLPGVHALLSQSPCDVFGSNGQLKWKVINFLRNEFGLKSQIALVHSLRDPEFQITEEPVWLVNRTLLL